LIRFSPGAKPSERGTFQIRGIQIASLRNDWIAGCQDGHFDITVMVKKLDDSNSPITVFDVLDSWRQGRTEIDFDKEKAKRYFHDLFNSRKIDSVIFPNNVMRDDIGYKHCTTIYHHYYPWIKRNPIRKKIERIGYQGDPRFLGEWKEKLEKIGSFVITDDLSKIDVAIAVRGSVYANFLSRSYKSNVKLANCYGSGTPCIVWPEKSYLETACDGVKFFTNEEELRSHLSDLESYEIRKEISDSFIRESKKYSIETIGKQYKTYFEQLRCL